MVSRSQSGTHANGPEMFPLGELDDPNLSMHMYRAFQNILAAREGMWGCLLGAIKDKSKRELLETYGWEILPEEEEEDALRVRFEQRLDKFSEYVNLFLLKQ